MSYNPIISFLDICPKKHTYMCIKSHVQKNVHRSIIFNNQIQQIAQISSSRMDKLMEYIYIKYSNKINELLLCAIILMNHSHKYS